MNNQPQEKKKLIKDIVPMMLGEIIIAGLVCLGFGILHFLDIYEFNLTIVWGAILGAVVIIANYLALTISIDMQLKSFKKERGDKEMSEEEIHQFTKKGTSAMQKAIKLSMFLRTGSMMLALVLAFITGWFNPIATAIPMFAFRPLLTVVNLVFNKPDKAPDPSKFIKYDYDDEINEEKEEY